MCLHDAHDCPSQNSRETSFVSASNEPFAPSPRPHLTATGTTKRESYNSQAWCIVSIGRSPYRSSKCGVLYPASVHVSHAWRATARERAREEIRSTYCGATHALTVAANRCMVCFQCIWIRYSYISKLRVLRTHTAWKRKQCARCREISTVAQHRIHVAGLSDGFIRIYLLEMLGYAIRSNFGDEGGWIEIIGPTIATATKVDTIKSYCVREIGCFIFSLRLVFSRAEFDGFFRRSIFFLFEFLFFFGAVWRTRSFFLVFKKHGIFSSVPWYEIDQCSDVTNKNKCSRIYLTAVCVTHRHEWFAECFESIHKRRWRRFDRSHGSDRVDRSLKKWGEVIRSWNTRGADLKSLIRNFQWIRSLSISNGNQFKLRDFFEIKNKTNFSVDFYADPFLLE